MKNFIIYFAFTLSFCCSAQDIHFSQVSYSPLALNPALAGANYDLQANINYRTQWNSVADPFNTMAASVDARLNTERRNRKAHLAMGLNFFNDQAGARRVTTNNVNLNLASHLIINPNQTFGAGLYVGMAQRSFNDVNGKWGNQYNGLAYDATLPSGETFDSPNFMHLDAGAGLLYTYKSVERFVSARGSKLVNVGFAAYHLNKPAYSFLNRPEEKMYIRFSGFFNGSFSVKDSPLKFEPGVYFHQQGNAREVMFGAYGRYMIKSNSHVTSFYQQSSVALGLFCRNQDALIAKVNYEWSGIGVGFAYDFNILSSLTSLSRARGGMEFFLRWVIPNVRAAYIR